MSEQVSSSKTISITAVVIAAFAIFLRMPSCYESFWLDELHSAWVVWDGISDVYPRSVIGHQSPVYFYLLWAWKQLVGTSEVMLRLSSVLAVGLSCGLLTIAVARWSRGCLAGAIAGLILAVENNSLFFGTELRPYSWVILFSTVATAAFLRLWTARTRHDNQTTWILLIAALVGAALFQPTSLGVLAWLPLILCLRWLCTDFRSFFRFSWIDIVCGIMVLAAGIALWIMTLQESWQQKSIWSAFGTAVTIQQVVQIWNWTWLLILPLAMLTLGIAIHGFLSLEYDRGFIGSLLAIALLAFGTTCLYWACSFFEFAPLWHRRYFLAILPWFACIGGGSVGFLQRSFPNPRVGSTVAAIAGGVLILGLGIQQRTLPRLRQYPVALVTRGEDWRGAVDEINANSNDMRRLHLDSGLIEGHSWIIPDLFRPGIKMQMQREYLTFPVHGPYKTRLYVIPVGSNLEPLPEAMDMVDHDSRNVITLTRRPAWLVRQHHPNSPTRGFGGVSVVSPK